MLALLQSLLLAWPWDKPAPPAPPPLTFLELWTDSIVWGTGWLGFCLSLLVTQMPTTFSMALVQTMNNATYGVQYAFLGAWSGCATQAIAVTNGILKLGVEFGMSKCKTVQQFTPYALVPLFAYTYSKPLDLLPFMAVALRLISLQAADASTARLIALAASTPWIPYCLALGQMQTLLAAVLAIGLQLLTIWRHSGSPATKRGKSA